MDRKALSDLVRLLASEEPEFRGGARVLRYDDTLSGLLEEIDATVLPARLTFEAEGRTLEMEVIGRRLHRIGAGGPASVTNRPLDPDDAATVDAAARALSEFASGAVQIRVRMDALETDAVDMSDRISVAKLAEALGLDTVADVPADLPLHESFRRRLGNTVTAMIHLVDHEVADMSGSGADLTGLRIAVSTQLTRFLRTREEVCPSHTDPSLTVLSFGTDDAAIALAAFGADLFLIALRPKDLVQAISAFQSTVRQS